MATVRRPRIKGVVAALPVRRKNAETKVKSNSDFKIEEPEKKLGVASPTPAASLTPNQQDETDDWCIQNCTDKPPPPGVEKPENDNILAIIEQPSELAERTRNDGCVSNEECTEVVDGIIPLATPASVPTLEQLKNEIISESAEVLFDPIVPLPSPSKTRPKLRPAPRLPCIAPARRTSLHSAGSPLRHSSASESEEEGRRSQVISSQIHHNSSSTCGTLPPAPTAAHSTPAVSHSATSPVKSAAAKQRRIATRDEAVRRRMKAHHDLEKRDQLTMYDLIFYNPTTNPIEHEDSKKTEKVEAMEDTKPAATGRGEETKTAAGERDETTEGEMEEPAPAPQLKIGADGSVVVDEKSLVLAPTWETRRKLSDTVIQESDAVRQGGYYRRHARTTAWSDADTVRFYRALAAIGTDFSLMAPLFPDRTRRDIKTKFKKEERNNLAQVERALASRGSFNVDALATEFARERREQEQRARELQERAKRYKQEERERAAQMRRDGMRLSKANRASMETMPERRPSAAPGCAADLVALSAADACQPVHRSAARKRRSSADAARKRRTTADCSSATPLAPPAPLTPTAIAHRAGAVAPGSVVCLAIPDPRNPSLRVLQTYVSDSAGKLRALSVPPAALAKLAKYLPGNATIQAPAQPPS